MKIGLRGGHSPNCKGAFGILDEQAEVRKIYNETAAILRATLCLGRIRQEEGDEIFVEEDRNVYRRLIMKDGVPEGILLQGDIAHSGIWQRNI